MAGTTIEAGQRGDKLRGDDAEPAKLRLVTRRSRLLGAQGELWPDWRYHSFVTDRDDLDTKAADAYHRGHATVELAIRDLKDNGLRRCPSGRFFANGAWLACSVLAHNLARWTARLGRAHPARQLTVAATVPSGCSNAGPPAVTTVSAAGPAGRTAERWLRATWSRGASVPGGAAASWPWLGVGAAAAAGGGDVAEPGIVALDGGAAGVAAGMCAGRSAR